jgi:hypothetical protein
MSTRVNEVSARIKECFAGKDKEFFNDDAKKVYT